MYVIYANIIMLFSELHVTWFIFTHLEMMCVAIKHKSGE